MQQSADLNSDRNKNAKKIGDCLAEGKFIRIMRSP